MARIKRVTREKEWTRKDDDDDDDRATRIVEDGGGGKREGGEEVVTRSRGIVNCGACTARLLVTVTVHLHSDLLNNAGIILRGKKKERTLGGHEERRRSTFSHVCSFTHVCL